MLGYAVAAVLILGSQYWFFRRAMPSGQATRSHRGWEREIWSYSWPIALFGIFTWAQAISDRWALQLFEGTHGVGLYAVLFQLGYYPILVLAGVGLQFLAPIYFQRAGNAQDSQRTAGVVRLTWRVTGLALGCTALGFVIAFVFHAEIFRIFVSAEYVDVSGLLPWVLLGGGLVAASQAMALGLLSQIRTQEMMPAKIGTPKTNAANIRWISAAIQTAARLPIHGKSRYAPVVSAAA